MDGDNAMGSLAQAIENSVRPHGLALSNMIPMVSKASADLVLGGTAADIPGMSVSYTPAAAETVLVIATFDWQIDTAGAGTFIGSVLVNGVARPTSAWWAVPSTTTERIITPLITLAFPGAVATTIKCQAYKTNVVVGRVNGATGSNGSSLLVVRFPGTISAELQPAEAG
jgi:hypothetical protein